MNLLEWMIGKEAPSEGDVHVPSAGSGVRRKPKPISATAVLPVTGATMAAQQENPDNAPTKKRGARNSAADLNHIQAMHDHACALGAQCGVETVEDEDGGDDVEKGGDAWEIPFKVAKADPDHQLIFGWASVVEKDGKLIIDKQGDAILPEDLEKAAYDFMLNARSHGEMHTMVGTGRCVESMVFTKAKQDAMGIDLGMVGWWTGFKVDHPETWAAHKRGDLPEFSIGGSGRRVPFL